MKILEVMDGLNPVVVRSKSFADGDDEATARRRRQESTCFNFGEDL